MFTTTASKRTARETTARGLPAVIGNGLVAGAIGTAAMTISSTIEAKVTGRGSSSTPASAVEEVADIEPRDEQAEQQLNMAAHWGYGTGWGVARGLLGSVGLAGLSATVAHFGLVWGTQQGMLPALGVAKPTWEYGGKALATDVLHHVVYATVCGAAYDWLNGR